MKRKILSFIMVLAMVLTILPASLMTVSAESTGSCGDSLTWTLYDSGELVISGEGAMTNYSTSASSRAPWYNDKAGITKVTIEDGVTTIGKWVFNGHTAMKEITIPSTVTAIGIGAFNGCTGLENLIIPEGVTTIDNKAFIGCKGLTSVTIPTTVTKINTYAFSGCTSLTDVYYAGMQEDWDEITISTYNECLTNATLHFAEEPEIPVEPERVIIASGDCGDNLTWVLYEDGELVISGEGAMCDNCSWAAYSESIIKVTIEEGVTSIGDYAFEDCTSLTSIVIPDSVTSIGEWAFFYCRSLTSIEIPDSVTSIGDSAFYYCDSLTSITIPNSVTSIGEWAFGYCESLTSIAIPDSVTSIGKYTFCVCSSLTSITIPDSVTSIGDEAFAHCESLTSINVEENNNYYSSINGVLFNENKTEIVCCPGGKVGEYEIPDSVTSIGYAAFEGCTSLTSIAIPDSVTSIGDWAFQKCESLTSIEIPDGVTRIGVWVFYGCSSLTSIEIPDSVTSIDDSAFWDCASLTSIVIPDSVTSIAGNAFSNCTSLTSIAIPDSVASIGGYAFYNCTSLTDVYYSGTEEEWNAIAIDTNNEDLTNATLHFAEEPEIPVEPERVIIASGDCGDNLTWVLYEDGELVISGEGAMTNYSTSASSRAPWYDNKGIITKVTIDEGVTSIGKWVFNGHTAMEDIAIPSTVTTIGIGSFNGCTGLESIIISEGVKTIDNKAFIGCNGLKSVTIPTTVTKINTYAFNGCTSLTDVYYPGTQEEWDAITISTYNEPLKNANFHFGVVVAEGVCGDNLTWALYEDGKLVISGTGNMYNYGVAPWYNDYRYVTSVIIEDGVTSIGDCAFTLCSLTSITIPDSVTRIGGYAFDRCASLTDIVLPDSITYIGNGAFAQCKSLTSISIPDSVTKIHDNAFPYCESLVSIDVDPSNPNYASIDGVLFNKDLTTLICYPGGRMGEYTIPDGVTSLNSYSFFNCLGLTSITTHKSVTYVGTNAFDRCYNLTDVYYIGTVEDGRNIKMESGNECLINANIHYIIPTLAEGTCGDNVSWVLYDDGELVISGEGAMYDWEYYYNNYAPWYAYRQNITKATIESGVTNVGWCAFYECASLTSVTIADTVTSIGDFAFDTCYSLTNVVMPYGVTTIGTGAFRSCSSLATITIPTSVTTIKSRAFLNCDALTTVYYAGTQEDWYAIDIGSDNDCLINASGFPPKSVPMESIVLNYGTLQILEGDMASLSITINPWNTTNTDIVGLTTDENVAVFDPSTTSIVAVGAGTATIRIQSAENPDVYAECVVEVIGETVETQVSAPTASTPSGETVLSGTTVFLSTETEGADIYFTPDGSEPSATNGYLYDPDKGLYLYNSWYYDSYYNEHFQNNYDRYTFKAIAVKEGMVDSSVSEFVYEVISENLPAIVVEDATSIDGGKTVDVKISLRNNPGLVAMRLNVDYDTSAMKLINVTDAGILGGASHSVDYTMYPYVLCWENATATDNIFVNGEIVTLTFELNDNIQSGLYPVTVSYDLENYDIINSELRPVANFYCVQGRVVVNDIMYGDVNDDGKVNVMDSIMLLRYVANWPDVVINSVNADVNKDGKVNLLDSVILRRHIADWSGYRALPFMAY